MPHWRLACSRIFRCSECSTPLVARPSTVAIFLPCASTPNIRHEHTTRPSTSTLHAPQSPVRHPSLAPVSSTTSRSVSSRLCRGSHRNSTVSPLIVASTSVFLAIVIFAVFDFSLVLFRALGRNRNRTAGEHPRNVTPILRSAAHVVDSRGRFARRTSGGLEAPVVEFFAHQPPGRPAPPQPGPGPPAPPQCPRPPF